MEVGWSRDSLRFFWDPPELHKMRISILVFVRAEHPSNRTSEAVPFESKTRERKLDQSPAEATQSVAERRTDHPERLLETNRGLRTGGANRKNRLGNQPHGRLSRPGNAGFPSSPEKHFAHFV